MGVAQWAPLELSVSIECPAFDPTKLAIEPGLGGYLRAAQNGAGKPARVAADHVELDDASGGVRYRVELGRMARDHADFDVALAVGNSVLAPVHSWLLRPSPVPAQTLVRVALEPDLDRANFATGLTPDGSGFVLRANEVRVATFSVFGRFEGREFTLPSVRSTPARVHWVTLDGALAVPRDVVHAWVEQTSRAVADFYGGFPVERALVVLAPVRNAGRVVHGKVLPESSPAIALLVGNNTSATGLYADWILTHELFHLGFPSFIGEGKWLDEGLATYYEPLIRARQGWLEEIDVWREFYRNMPQGLDVLQRDGLESPHSVRGMYWAGVIVCLLADVEALARSNGRRGLATALRELLRAGGHASRVWRLSDAIGRLDTALGAPVLARLNQRYGQGGSRLDLRQRFAALGVVESNGQVTLDDTAPLATVRQAIGRLGR